MSHCFPDATSFVSNYENGQPQIVWTTLITDLETPVSAMLKLKDESPYHLLFESVQNASARGRYSIIAFDPDILWKCEGGKTYICRDVHADTWEEDPRSVFDSLRALTQETSFELPDEVPQMAAGLYGYMGYPMIRYMEDIHQDNPDNIGIEDAIYMRPRMTVIFDSVRDEAYICTPVYPSSELSAAKAYNSALQRIEDTVDTLKLELKQSLYQKYYADADGTDIQFKSHVRRELYDSRVEKAKEYIRAGDIFQVVPSRRMSAPFELPPFSLYRSLRHLNPSPYLFYMHLKDKTLIGSSPEILVRVEDRKVTVRPIAGTRPRGANDEKDLAFEKDLLADPKERAEHLMLLDLGRNDVGRVAAPCSVEVTEDFIIERYSHVMHIVSNVEGVLAEGKDAIDALTAAFPAGTVSGAPKIRAMEIIDELEHESRSFYAGTIGYIGVSGDMDSCIALRTGLVKDNTLYIQAGGGIVADSDPEAEWNETENKARAMMVAAKKASLFL